MNSQPLNLTEQRLAEVISDVAAELVDSNANIAQIQEDFFVKVFLPMFAGDEEISKKVKPEMWFNLARGPFNEVAVYNTQGHFLFNVPAFYSQQVIKPLDGTGKAAGLPTITDVAKQAQHHAFRGPGMGEAFMAQEMERRSFMFNTAADLSEDNKRWMDIFARYGIHPVQPKATALNQTPPNVDPARDSSEFESLC